MKAPISATGNTAFGLSLALALALGTGHGLPGAAAPGDPWLEAPAVLRADADDAEDSGDEDDMPEEPPMCPGVGCPTQIG